MQFGLSLSSSVSPRSSQRAAAEHLVNRVRAASDLDSISIGDSHARGAPGYFQNTPTMGRVLAEWTTKPGGCLFLLPLWSPVLVAEQVGTLAAFHDGPFIVQTGMGHGPEQFRALGASPEHRVTVFNESVRVVSGLLRGESVTSELFGFSDVALGLIPDQPVDWWMGTMSEPGVRRAAAFGAAWYVAPDADEAVIQPLLELYRVECARFGTEPRVMLRREMSFSKSGDDARSLARQGPPYTVAGSPAGGCRSAGGIR
jgi:alkanesulfonate monooxygenase SsuD/methylene tetrahydromethanopterin reductase-like flavin-dependent oxidoreductase (luciferase family)